MSRTFLQLCSDAVSDLGVAGGVIQSVTGVTEPQLQRVINWVARADILIQAMWSDWKFLWYQDAITIAAGVDTFATSFPFDDIDHRSLIFNPSSATISPSFPQWMEWETFSLTWQSRIKVVSQFPTNWSIDPSGKIWLSHITAAALPARISYWLIPKRMVANSDTSLIPSKFDTVIVERAKIIYAERMNAPEILSGSTAEYSDLIEKLESSYLPSQRATRKSRNDRTTNPNGFVE